MSAASTSTFIQGMDNLKANKLVNGENGTLEHISTENSLVDLFFKLMRGMEGGPTEQSSGYSSICF